MSRLLLLIKVFLKNSFFAYNAKRNSKKKGSRKGLIIFIIIIMAFSLSTVVGSLFHFSYSVTKAMIEIDSGLDNLFIAFILPIISLVLFVTSIFTVLSLLFLSTDTDKIIHMPIKPWEILLARMTLAYFTTLLVEFIMILPILIGTAIALNAGILFYAYAVLITLLLPIIPLIISALISMILMRFVSITKFRQRYIYIVSIVGIAFALTISFLMQSISLSISSDQDFNVLIELIDKYAAIIFGNIFPFVIPAIYTLSEYTTIWGFLFFLGYLGINVLFVILLLLIGTKLYFRGLRGNSETHSKQKEVKNVDYQNYSNVLGYSKKEFKSLIRSPIAFMNTVLPVLIMPVITIISIVISVAGGGGNITEIFGEIKIDWNKSSILFYLIAVSLFLNGMNMVSSTAISREGVSSLHIKYMPIKPATIIHGKMLIGVLLNFLVFILLFVPAAIIFKIDNIFYYLLLPIIILLLSYITNYIGLCFDISNPKIYWDNESRALKQNFTLVLVMLLDMMFAVLFLLFGLFINYLEAKNFVIPFSLATTVTTILLILVTFLIYRKISHAKSSEVFRKII